MNRRAYFQHMRQLADQLRTKYGFRSPRVGKADLRIIYRDEGIRIDLWPYFKSIRGAYLCDEQGPTVVINKKLPEDPCVFTMAHELKHHFVDRQLKLAACDVGNQNEEIEIGAEVFASELILPEGLFTSELQRRGVVAGKCSAEHLVEFKRSTRTTLSYAGLEKYAMRLGFGPSTGYAGVQWKKLELELYGEPPYKKFIRARNRKRA